MTGQIICKTFNDSNEMFSRVFAGRILWQRLLSQIAQNPLEGGTTCIICLEMHRFETLLSTLHGNVKFWRTMFCSLLNCSIVSYYRVTG